MEFVKTICCLILFLWSSIFYSQGSYFTKHYTVNTGLLASDVRTVFIDSNHVLWIGSRSGLSKMVQGEIRTSNTALKHRFTNVTNIVETDKGAMFFSSYGQGILYQYQQESKVIGTKEGLASDRIRNLFIYRDKLYVGSTEGVSIINTDTFEINTPAFETSVEEKFEISGFFEYDNQVYATTINHGTYAIEKGRLNKINDHERVFSVYREGDLVFYGCQTGLIIEDFKTKQIVYKGATPSIQEFRKINGVVYFVCAGMYENNGGLYKWDGQKAEPVSTVFNLPVTDLLTLAFDKQNEFVYIGSKSSGLYKVQFSNVLNYDTSVKNIMALANLNQSIFVFYKKGLLIQKSDGSTKEVDATEFKNFQTAHHLKYKDLTSKKNHFFELDYNTPAHKIIFYTAKVNANHIWVSSNIGMFKLNSTGEILEYINVHNYQFEFLNNHLFESNPYGGIRIYSDLQTMKYTYYPDANNTKIPRAIVDIQEVNNRLFFAGALDGLYSYEASKGFTSLSDAGVFDEKRIKLLTKGPNNKLYVSTSFNDVYCLEVNKDQIKAKRVVLSSNILGANISLMETIGEKLFIGTNKGLTVITPSGQFYFDAEQGFADTEITAFVKSKNLLFIGTNSGLYTLDTTYFEKKASNSAITLTSVVVNGKDYVEGQRDITQLKQLKLPYRLNSIQLTFAALEAKYPEKLVFRYRLKPTSEWNVIKNSTITLHYLESGVYPIELNVYDYSSGVGVTYPLLYVEIEKPFYLRTWFFVVCGLALVLVTVFIYKGRIRILKRKQEVQAKKLLYEKRLAEVKLLAVRSQMNSHFVFNVMSSIQYYILDNQSDKAFDYLGDFAKLIRLSLSNSLKERISLREELDYLKKYVSIENIRFDDRIEFKITKKANLDVYGISIPPMLLQPFIENSIVHAFPSSIKNPLIEIEIKEVGTDLELIVRDNGIGSLSKTLKRHEEESIGLSLVKERMAFIQEYLEEDLIITITDFGTEVTMRLKNIIKN